MKVQIVCCQFVRGNLTRMKTRKIKKKKLTNSRKVIGMTKGLIGSAYTRVYSHF